MNGAASMTNIHFEQRSRSLVATIGTPGADDALAYNITPVNIKQGKRLLDLAIGISMRLASDEEVIEAYEIALGEENFTRAIGPILDGAPSGEGELRPEEWELLANAALFWQAHGGSMRFVEQLEAGEAIPKVAAAYLMKVGLTPEKLATLRASIANNTGSNEPTAQPGTEFPNGSKTN